MFERRRQLLPQSLPHSPPIPCLTICVQSLQYWHHTRTYKDIHGHTRTAFFSASVLFVLTCFWLGVLFGYHLEVTAGAREEDETVGRYGPRSIAHHFESSAIVVGHSELSPMQPCPSGPPCPSPGEMPRSHKALPTRIPMTGPNSWMQGSPTRTRCFSSRAMRWRWPAT